MILHQIAKETGISRGRISTIVRSSDNRYRTYSIEKRGGGSRIISQPSKKLKFIQRWLVNNVFNHFPIHSCATAYKKGKGIANNAKPHLESKYLLKLDFKDFFPSIKYDDVHRLISENSTLIPGFENGDADFISNAVCYRHELTIGAPSSPIISNAMLFDFDNLLQDFCKNNLLCYTRYADDLSISSIEHEKLLIALNYVKECLDNLVYPRLTLNEGKTVFVSKKHKRYITGLVLTSDGKLSIGRKRKKELKSLFYQFKKTQLELSKIGYLRGWVSYVNAVEPEFNDILKRKYGEKNFNKLLDYDISFFDDELF